MNCSVKHLAVVTLALSVALPVAAWAGESYTTVNKSISLKDDSESGSVTSVNGAVRVGSNAIVRSIESVNGAISIDNDASVEKDVQAVNGAIELAQGAEVGGDVETVNGRIKMRQTNVGGDVNTVNGGIKLLDGTVVEGNVIVQKPNGWSNSRKKPVKVEIGKDVRVVGDLIFEHPVELRIHDSATVGDVIGDDVTVIEG